MPSPDFHVLFAELPPEQTVGGIDLAMETLEACLSRSGEKLTRRASLRDLREANEPCVVHFHGLWQPRHSIMSQWCRSRGIPYVISPHGMLEPWAWSHKKWKKWPYYHLLERWHLRGADRVLATSDLEAQNLSDFVSPSSIATIPLALPEDAAPNYEAARIQRSWPDEETVLVYLSRLHQKKGMHLLLEGLAEVPDPLTESVRLVVVGDGPADYKKRLRSIEESNRDRLPPIDWEGAVWGDEKWTYLQGADLFCLPTHSENFGLVVLEACQVGTPVLTTTGTPWRFLEDWNSGLITEPNTDSLETALQRYLTSFSWSQTQRTELAERTRKRFSLESVGRQYLDMYTTVIEETSALHSR